MTRVLLMGDIHARDRAPANCTDSYMDDIFDLLEQTVDMESALGCDAVVWAGDVFDFKQPSKTSHATVLRLARLAKKYTNLLIVVGNHDISNDILHSVYDKQPLGVLLEAGAHELNGWHHTLPIYGVPWQQAWSDPESWDEAFESWRNGLKHGGVDTANALVVTHAPIYPPAQADNQMFELVPTPLLAGAMEHKGYLYYGHIHEDHGVFEDGGVTFCNPGAISRGSLHEYNVNRAVKVAVWDSETGFEQYELKYKPASEVFRMAEVTERQTSERNFEAFLSDIGTASLEMSSTASVIEHVQGLDLEPKVISTAIELLQEFS